jgi:hypothetical protein
MRRRIDLTPPGSEERGKPMSLDVYLTVKDARIPVNPERIFIREDGETREITLAEWNDRSDRIPVTVRSEGDTTDEVFSANITHNLGKMADEAGLYLPLWRPEEMDPPAKLARDLVEPLRAGLAVLEGDPDHFRTFNPENGWGDYEGLVRFTRKYLTACEEWPDAEVYASR